MATLTYKHFGNHGQMHLRALCFSTQESMTRVFSDLLSYEIMLVRARDNLVGPTPRRLVAAH